MILTPEQRKELGYVKRRTATLEKRRIEFEAAERGLRRAVARAVAEGVPLRAIAQYAEVSHVTVRAWANSVTPEELGRTAPIDRASWNR